MAYYRIVNEDDGNESFLVEAADHDCAAHNGLRELGWFVAAIPVEEDEGGNEDDN